MTMEITFINVGYGEAILVREAGFTMLIDGGDDADAEYAGGVGRVRCAEFLKQQGVRRVDVMVNTHIHQDHTCGLTAVAREILVGEFWTPLLPNLPDRDLPENADDRSTRMFVHALNGYRRLLRDFAARGTPVRGMFARSEPVALPGGMACDVLGPDERKARATDTQIERIWASDDPLPLARDLDARMNNVSLMLRLGFEGRHALLVGDTNRDGYGHLAADDERLRAELYKIGHHGQLDGVSAEQLDRAAPECVIFTASSDRRYDSAHPDVVQMVRARGAAPLFTDNLPEYIDKPHSALTVDLSAAGVAWRYE